jgi:hypothetical protein
LKEINNNYLDEDIEYKRSLKRKIKGETDLIKSKLKEKYTTFNTVMSTREMETCINYLFIIFTFYSIKNKSSKF